MQLLPYPQDISSRHVIFQKTFPSTLSFWPLHFLYCFLTWCPVLQAKHNASTVQLVQQKFLPRSALLRHSCGEATMRSKTKSFGVERLGRLTDLKKFQVHLQQKLAKPSKMPDSFRLFKSFKRTWHKTSLFPDYFMPLSKRHIAGKVGRSHGFSGFSWNRRWRRHRHWWHWWGWDGLRSWTCHWGLPKWKVNGCKLCTSPVWRCFWLLDVDKCDFSLILAWFVTHRLPLYFKGSSISS